VDQLTTKDALLAELTLRALLLGAFITVLFTTSNVYLGLKVDLADPRAPAATRRGGGDSRGPAGAPRRAARVPGLIVGESLMGVLMAGIIGATGNQTPLVVVGAGFEGAAEWLGLSVFLLVCTGFYQRVLRQA
jgi:hypothetical protein